MNKAEWDEEHYDPMRDLAEIQRRLENDLIGIDYEIVDAEVKRTFCRIIADLPPPITLGVLRSIIGTAIHLWGEDLPVYRTIRDGSAEESWLFLTVRRAVDEMPERFVIGGG